MDDVKSASVLMSAKVVVPGTTTVGVEKITRLGSPSRFAARVI
jgi:hypothetical protein